MKLYNKISIFIIIFLLITVSVVSYSIGRNNTKNEDSKTANKLTTTKLISTSTPNQEDCSYVQQEYDDIQDKMYANKIKDRSTEPPPDFDAVKALEGGCLIPSLEKAYDLGIRYLRNSTDCYPVCIVTEDYNIFRIDFRVVNDRMVDIIIG